MFPLLTEGICQLTYLIGYIIALEKGLIPKTP